METPQLRTQIIDRVCQYASARGMDNLELFSSYANAVTHRHPDETLLSWEDTALWGIYWGLLRFVRDGAPEPPQVRVFNPDLDADGWVSDLTVIYFSAHDIPFLVDSMRIALNRMRMNIRVFESNPVHVSRNPQGAMEAVEHSGIDASKREDHGFILIDFLADQSEREQVQQALQDALDQVYQVVADFHPMLDRLGEVIEELQRHLGEQLGESLEFLRWLQEGNFTFLGVSEFRLEEPSAEDPTISEIPGERLGLMRKRADLEPTRISNLTPGFARFYQREEDLAYAKSVHRSSVHRDTYPDYVVVKRRNDAGQVIGETRFLGLYTARLYHLSVQHIPLVRSKVKWLIDQSGLDPDSHNGKAFMAILEGHPRDELIQSEPEQLLATTLGIWKIYERRTVKLFVRVGPFQKFVTCIVYLPRESLRTEIRERIAKRLTEAFAAQSHEYTTQFLAESVLARIHFNFLLGPEGLPEFDLAGLEASVENIVHDWGDRFVEICHSHFGDTMGNRLARRYRDAFTPGYRHQMTPLEAVNDLELFRHLKTHEEVAMSVHQPPTAKADRVRLKMFRRQSGIELSDMIPMLEHLGFRVLEEHPFRITPENEELIWMQDFVLSYRAKTRNYPEISSIKTQFREAFHAIWLGLAENDGFNRLIVSAGFDWRQVSLLRAYARYMKQLGTSFSLDFMAETLVNQVEVTRHLLELFGLLLNPDERDDEAAASCVESIQQALEQVSSLNEDQLLRHYLELIQATRRSNFYQLYRRKDFCLALKLATREISCAPDPRPEFEVFVYSTRVEGVHLRGGHVARGGIRWSDRAQDFRTEVLGLVKAQQVKNSVIVPTGAKGGFIARKASPSAGREAFLEEGKAAYRLFIGSLLDISDNLKADEVIHPEGIVARDEDDPYLVVAADKGTATFSDLANEIAESHDFWLGDAFASGGSQGYDHKKMGITARGAWVAVQRHFRELGLNTQTDDFSVIGIGDMAGDVFGNGMLLSKTLRLLAAFNHQHIFFDPNPDSQASWVERKRLFDLPRSSWADYDSALISQGGGIFERSAKYIEVTDPMRELLGIESDRITPDKLINALLKAPVDLLWNGGIGTYVKATGQSHADVGDRANDLVRVNGNELRCRVFGEGGNLGMTQRGRIEFCQQGGICNTDFIDNVGGVDCSDHEVNIKILLNGLVAGQDLTLKQRNDLLVDMTDEVATHVLHNSYRQTLGLSLASRKKDSYHFHYQRFMEYLESQAGLNRALEYLPDDETLRESFKEGTAWTRPELAVLVSYAKNDLKRRLLQSGIAEDSAMTGYAYRPFPTILRERWAECIGNHRLRNEIVCNELANDLVNRAGFSFCFRLADALGVGPEEVARAWHLVFEVFNLDSTWRQVESLDYQLDSSIQYEMFHEINRLARRCSRWFLRNFRDAETSKTIETMKSPLQNLVSGLAQIPDEELPEEFHLQFKALGDQGVDDSLARVIAASDLLFLMPGCVTNAAQAGLDVLTLFRYELQISQKLGVNWLMQFLIELNPGNRWQDLAREAHFFDLETLLRVLATKLATLSPEGEPVAEVDSWLQGHQARVERFQRLLGDLRSGSGDLSVVTVCLADLKDLADAASRDQRLAMQSE